MSVTTLTRRELNRATLARQLLLEREKAPVLHAIERLVGLQAQLARPPFIGLWSRLEGFQREELTRLLLRREVVRAPLMRCTLHLMSARDYLTLRAALQPVLGQAMRSALRERAKGLDIQGLVATTRTFFGEEPRTFEELRAFLLERYPKGDERAMGYAVRTHLPLVQVPTEAEWGFPGTADFAVAESWLGAPLEADEKPHPLVLRYLAAFGPATVNDVQTWSGLTGLRDVLEELRPKLRTFQDERGRELFDLPKAPRPPADTPAPVRFIPEYDNLVLAHEDRTRLVADAHRSSIFKSNLRILPTFLVEGFVAGTWKVERKKASATLLLEPFEALSKRAREELAEEGDGLIRFVEGDARTFEVRFAKAVG
jgi:hypothetical protein